MVSTRVQMLWANFEKAMAIADPTTRSQILADLDWARRHTYPGAAQVIVADATRLYLENLAVSTVTAADILEVPPGSLFRYVGSAYGKGFATDPSDDHKARVLIKGKGGRDVFGECRAAHALVESVHNLGFNGFRKYILALKSEDLRNFVPLLLGVVVFDPSADEADDPEPRYTTVAWESAERAADAVIMNFKNEGETGNLWRVLGGPESTLQYLFEFSFRTVATRFGISVDPQSNHGAGEVDLCISRGAIDACCVELKLASHPKLKTGLTRQLPAYMRSRGTTHGRYVVVCRDGDPEPAQIATLLDEALLALDSSLDVAVVIIDARSRPSASRL